MTGKGWLLGILAGLIIAFFAVYPQINLQNLRGDDFEGAFATYDLDEMAYASYLQALIDGRPRKNDPYTGRDDSAENPQPESLFSIQFFPAYLVAVPARILGLSVPQVMPILSAVSAFLTALALFWLIVSISENHLLAMVGTLIVLVGSAMIVGIGAINGFYEHGVAYPFFPFLRRYIPSLAFPFMFAFFACLWNGLKTEAKEKRAVYSAFASLCFAATVFSYFYVWTSAAAVLFALTLFVLVFRTENRRKDFLFLAITAAFCVLSLVPYALLLASRNQTMDKAQLLVFTRQPDLLRSVEIIGYLILILLTFALWQRFTDLKEKKAYFIAAFAAAPCLVFNQQILTGRSLQPFHYEFYAINYVVLLAVVLIAAVFWQKFISPKKTLSIILLSVLGIAAVGWGYIEAKETSKFWDDINVRRDEAMPVNRRLRELAGENIEAAKHQTTLNLEALQADSQPTVAPQAVLWARHQHVFAGLKDWEENRKRYYQLLYYLDLDENHLRNALTGCRDIEACMALFGWDRFNARLSANARPLALSEVEAEVRNFAGFSQNFSREDARNPMLSYLVVYSN
ncbi:MAG TPA: hypothetical protein VK892_10450, partial [Pyrinomonadaceae bacterium]|nr:hypothetical protein [Pyrinomonadaceae bacterium]